MATPTPRRERDPYTVVDLTPEPMRAALREQGRLGLELARDWLEADDDTQADILAFFASDGPAKVERATREIAEREQDEQDGDGWKHGAPAGGGA